MMQLAVLIVLLHSFVPHHHHEESASAVDCISLEQEQSQDFLGLLEDLFHTDLGDDHLENWVKSNSQTLSFVSFDLDICAITAPSTPTYVYARRLMPASSSPEGRPRQGLVNDFPQRGPPSHILA